MSFIRPEAAATARRWSGVIIAAGVFLLGLWWGMTSLGVIKWFGWALAAGAGATAWALAQRARFRGGHGGLGVLEVDERQIAYFAPVGGGVISLEALTGVAIGPDRAGLPVWIFSAPGEMLRVPASAEGTAALFDVLAALGGADLEAAIRASRSHPDRTTVIWKRPLTTLH